MERATHLVAPCLNALYRVPIGPRDPAFPVFPFDSRRRRRCPRASLYRSRPRSLPRHTLVPSTKRFPLLAMRCIDRAAFIEKHACGRVGRLIRRLTFTPLPCGCESVIARSLEKRRMRRDHSFTFPMHFLLSCSARSSVPRITLFRFHVRQLDLSNGCL